MSITQNKFPVRTGVKITGGQFEGKTGYTVTSPADPELPIDVKMDEGGEVNTFDPSLVAAL